MSRGNYGRVGSSRRGGSAVWQWMIIGMIFATFCWAIVFLALLTVGVIDLNPEAARLAGAASPTPAVITATTDPNMPTNTPYVVTATPDSDLQLTADAGLTAIAGQQLIAPPSPTPTTDPNSVVVEASPTPTTQPAQALVPSNNVTTAQNPVPEPLRGLVSSLVRIDGGTYTMGTTVGEVAEAVRLCLERDRGQCDPRYGEDSYPAHSVTVDPFQIEITEVNYAQYIAFLNWKRSQDPNWRHTNGCDGQICLATQNDTGGENSYVQFDGANYFVREVFNNFLVVNVTWYGAKAYCEAIGRRLPTEAEWERAARGSDGRIYPWGNEWDATRAKTNRPTTDPVGAVEVGTRPAGASPFGVYDMAGNVGEWVSDWYSPTFYSQPEASGLNPSGPPTGVDKVIRGGSWDTVPFFARTVHRQNQPPTQQYLWLGFRCATGINTQTGSVPGASSLTVIGTPDPATLGTIPSGSEESTAADNSAPTLPAAPSSGQVATLQP